MKAILKNAVFRAAMMIKKLLGVPLIPGTGEPIIEKPKTSNNIYQNVFDLLKDYPEFAVKTEDVRLLRRCMKRYERMVRRGGPAAERALKQLERQWHKVVRNKTDMIEKEIARQHAVAAEAEPKILPMSGSTMRPHADEPGLSIRSNGAGKA